MSDRIVSSPIVPNDLYVRKESFWRTLWTSLDKNAVRLAMHEVATDERVTYNELQLRASLVASRLQTLGCRPRDVVSIFSPNSIAWVVVYLAVCRLGAIPAATNALLSVDELRHQLKTCEAKFVFTTQDLANTALDASEGLATLQAIVLLGAVHAGCVDLGSTPVGERLPPLPPADIMDMNPEDTFSIFFSSGTTGVQKAIMLSQHNAQYQYSLSLHPKIAVVDGPEVLTFGPYSHVVGAWPLLFGIAAGFTIHVMARFDLELFLRTLERYPIRRLIAVPPVATMMAKSPLALKYKLNNLEDMLIAAGGISSDVENLLMERFPWMFVRQVFGMTELAGFCSVSPYQDYFHQNYIRKPGSAGVPALGVQMKAVDIETGKALGPRQTGEILIRSDLTMSGYVNNLEATNNTVDADGWVHSGDIGYYDEDSYFFIVDRLKELIKYNGYQVPPAELEAVLLTHPDVSDAGVVGLYDAEHGELPLAWVVKKQNSAVTETQIQQFVDAKVAPFKKLRGGVHFVDIIPRTASGKILRRHIKAVLTKPKL